MTDLEFKAMLLEWDAQDAAERVEDAAKAVAKAAYYALVAEIDAAWAAVTNHDCVNPITDPCVDSQQAEQEVYESTNYWLIMKASAANAAGSRAEEAGYDINKVLGRSIY